MKRIGWMIGLLLLLTSCGKEYSYADQMFDFYADLIEKYEDAENVEELQHLRQRATQRKSEIEKEQQVSHEELIRDMEEYDEDAFLIHLDLLSAESHAQWMFVKRKLNLEEEK